MIHIVFPTPTTASMPLYRNGQQIATTLTNRYLTTLGDRQLLDIELGSTLNSGPTVPQQRPNFFPESVALGFRLVAT
ncbi:MAG: hypothetical protein WCS09_20705 [Pseudomonadota bacterium]